MQISTPRGNGTVSITTGTNRVIGSALADWTQVLAGSSWFSLIGDTTIPYDIQSKTAPGASASGFWEITLNGIYTLASLAGASYVIHKDFTYPWNLPLFEPGDVQRSQIWNRAMWIIAQNLGGAGGSGGPGGIGGMIANFATLTTLDKPKPSLWWKTVVQDGAIVLQWWLLQAGAPDPAQGDVDTSDDSMSRWRQVG